MSKSVDDFSFSADTD